MALKIEPNFKAFTSDCQAAEQKLSLKNKRGVRERRKTMVLWVKASDEQGRKSIVQIYSIGDENEDMSSKRRSQHTPQITHTHSRV